MKLQGHYIRLLTLQYVVARTTPHMATTESSVLQPSLMGALHDLSVANLTRLAYMDEPHIEIYLDVATFDHGIRSLKYIGKRLEEINHFIHCGATVSMLEKLFHLTPHEIANFRGSSRASKVGRPPMPCTVRREQIVMAWYLLRQKTLKDSNEIAQYRELHNQFSDLSLATLSAVVNEFAA